MHDQMQRILNDAGAYEDDTTEDAVDGWILRDLAYVLIPGQCWCDGKQAATEETQCSLCSGGLDFETIDKLITGAGEVITELLRSGRVGNTILDMEKEVDGIISSPHMVKRPSNDLMNFANGIELASDTEQRLLELVELLYAALGMPWRNKIPMLNKQPSINTQAQRGVQVRDFSRDTTEETRQRARKAWDSNQWARDLERWNKEAGAVPYEEQDDYINYEDWQSQFNEAGPSED